MACDASAWQLREFVAQSRIAAKLGKTAEAAKWQERADALRAAINKHLWCEADQIYYNVNRETGAFVLIDEASNDTVAAGMVVDPA